MRQGTGISKDMGNFKGTDNSRVEDMLSEANDFATKLTKYKKHLKEATAATKGAKLQLGAEHQCLIIFFEVHTRNPRLWC